MFSNESNPYFNSVLSRTSANSTDSPESGFVTLQARQTVSGKPLQQQTTEQRESLVHEVKPRDFLASNLVWLLPIWGAIVSLLLLGTASEVWKLFRYNVNTVKQGQRVPCKNCRFFSNNFYLKCAIRPSDALTERAIDCADFCQKLPQEESKPQLKRNVRH